MKRIFLICALLFCISSIKAQEDLRKNLKEFVNNLDISGDNLKTSKVTIYLNDKKIDDPSKYEIEVISASVKVDVINDIYKKEDYLDEIKISITAKSYALTSIFN